MKNRTFIISTIVLGVILVVVTFYMLFVHIHYYNYTHNLDEIRNQICEDNHYEYLDYFSEYRGKSVYYMLKVNIDGVESYVAYDTDMNLVDIYQGDVVSKEEVLEKITNKYDVVLEDLDIAYENERFVYYGLYQDDEMLLYVYYDLSSGDFIKAVKLDE
ncbi:MAG: hypothetical protein LUF02_02890 [Erysipelotrichaceae bacterium]|nr:hypothetical protein [Erysipelotrichaceae bacterium]